MSLFRKGRAIALCIAVMAVLLLGAIYVQKSRQRLDTRVSIELTKNELAAMTAAAEEGDASAAAKLSRHFLMNKDYKLAYLWMLRAKQLGDSGAESDLNQMRKFLPPDAITENAESPTPKN